MIFKLVHAVLVKNNAFCSEDALVFEGFTLISENGDICHSRALECSVVTDAFLDGIFLCNVYVVFGYVYVIVEVEQSISLHQLERVLVDKCHYAISCAAYFVGIDNILKPYRIRFFTVGYGRYECFRLCVVDVTALCRIFGYKEELSVHHPR